MFKLLCKWIRLSIIVPLTRVSLTGVSFPFSIYCINLKTSIERKTRMIQRFKINSLMTRVTFVDAIPYDAPIVSYYKGQSIGSYGEEFSDQYEKDVACFASHIKAIHTFLEQNDGQEYALICEDDILLHNDFLTRFMDVYNNLPLDAPILSLTYMISGPIDQTCVGHRPSCENLWRIDPQYTWGAQAYLISKQYAIDALTLYDCPIDTIINPEQEKITSEIILRKSHGYMVAKPIIIEDCINSDRATQDIPYHVRHFCYWNWINFNLSDPDKLSPLHNKNPSDAWEGYPFKESLP